MSQRQLTPLGDTGIEDIRDRRLNSAVAPPLVRSVSAEYPANYVGLIESRMLVRDTLASTLQNHIRSQVRAFSSVEEWSSSERDCAYSLIVLSELGRSSECIVSDIKEVLAHAAGTPCAILSDSEDPEIMLQILRSGAKGYIPTSLPMGVGIEALALVRAGGVYGPVSMLLDKVPPPPSRPVEIIPEPEDEEADNQFTPRQLDVIESLRRGKPNKLIAYELNMCEGTVKVHIRNIMRKLKATNRTEVAILANKFLK